MDLVRPFSLSAALLLVLSPPARAADPAPSQGPSPSAQEAALAFERLRGLVGEWQGETPSGEKVAVTYRLASGGSVVMEDLFPGTPHEMVTMYHLDGDALVLTHYCAMGNQPRMRLAEATPKDLRFEFTGGTNLRPEKDGHIHSALLRFLDPTHLQAEWTVYRDGKPVGANRYTIARATAAAK